MKQKDLDAFLATYLPERAWVTRVGNNVYKLNLPEIVFKGASVIKIRKWHLFKTLRARIGCALMDLGTSMIESEWSKRSMPYSRIENQMKQDKESNESL